MAGGANAGLRRGRRRGLLQGRRTRRHARPGQRLRQHRAARRQRTRPARLRRRGRGQPADRQGRADEDRRDDLPVEPERGDGAEEDRHQVGQGPRGKEGGRSVRIVADDDAAAAAQVQQPQGVGHQDDRHAGCVDGACAAAGPGRRGARLDRRLPDPGRVAGRAARRLSVRRLRRADGQHVDLRQHPRRGSRPRRRSRRSPTGAPRG